MEILHLLDTATQKEHWLEPIRDGEMRSAFDMSEPDVASSDATNITLAIVRGGDEGDKEFRVLQGGERFIDLLAIICAGVDAVLTASFFDPGHDWPPSGLVHSTVRR
jgi:alkylation response protein AidB-like acyl-CoA dehydrogenase